MAGTLAVDYFCTISHFIIDSLTIPAITYSQHAIQHGIRKGLNMSDFTECFLEEAKTHGEAQAAFKTAIKLGVLSENPTCLDFAGKWMYMGKSEKRLAFKNINTREYIHCIIAKAA